MKRGTRGIAAALALVLLAVLPGGALAAPAQVQYGLVVGTLGGTATGTITVTTPNSAATTIPVGAHTRYLPRSAAAFKAGLKSGDPVAVYTATTKSGTVAVTVQYDLKPFGVSTRVGGTITATTANSLTLATATNTSVTLTTTNKTRYTLDNRVLKAFTALPTNEPALITALSMTTGVTDARFVALGLPAKHVPGNLLRGSIGTQGPTTLALSISAALTLQVAVTPTTRYVVDGTLVSSVPRITSTEKVDIIASRSAGVFTADSVWIKTH